MSRQDISYLMDETKDMSYERLLNLKGCNEDIPYLYNTSEDDIPFDEYLDDFLGIKQ